MGIQNRFIGLYAKSSYGHIINIQTEIFHTQICSVHVSQHGYFHQSLKIDFPATSIIVLYQRVGERVMIKAKHTE